MVHNEIILLILYTYLLHALVGESNYKRTIVKLYNISIKKVEFIQASLKTGLGAPALDRRGKQYNSPIKSPEDVAAFIMQHISSFPTQEAHYSRNKNIHKKYLSTLLSVNNMHK